MQEPEDQEVVIYRKVIRFPDKNMQPKARQRVLKKILELKDPFKRRGSVKIVGRPPDDPRFRIAVDVYRVLYKREGSKVHVIDMDHRKDVY